MKKNTIAIMIAGRRQRRRRWIVMNILLLLLACVLCCAMLMLGSTVYPVEDVIRALLGERLDGVSFAVNTIRLPNASWFICWFCFWYGR
ncbi:hypothetical protein J26TS2_36200 [Shouchella clausii]|nr:hypothetical protein J26TS2_36200 [Shouchella clausii]